MIDDLCDRTMDQKIAVACFYCDFQSQKMQTAENVLGALIKQIVRGSGVIPAEVNSAFQKAKGQIGGRGLRVPEALELLRATLAPLGRVFICIDALDELLEKHLPRILRSLNAISQSLPAIRVFFTGRPHIGAEITRYFPGAIHFLEIKPTREDIVRYVEKALDDDSLHGAMNLGLRAEIMNRVLETISDVYVTAIVSSSLVRSLTVASRFLLVSLNIAAILDETTVHLRREQLKRMTNGRGLGNVYGVTLDRIKQSGGKSRLAMAALMWISRSERPMSADELCHALGVEIGSTNPNPDNIPSIQLLLASCLGLVIVDKEGSTVRLVHFTFQEYLNSRSEMFQNPYAVMAEVSLTYLNFDCVRKIAPILDDASQKYPFLEHASSCWGHYARNETTDGVKSLALQLLAGFDSHISAKLLLNQQTRELWWSKVKLPKGFTGLHCVACLGVDEIAEVLLDTRDWDVDRADVVGCTPLIWAAKNGWEGIIRLLLERTRAKLNAKDTQGGKTPLSWAARYGQEEAVKLLLQLDGVDPESLDNDGRTPLSCAAESGSEGVLKLFLEREDTNLESQDNSGRTPLSYAAESGSEEILKLLLGREEVNLESLDYEGQTPLSHAAWGGSGGVLKLLLQREEVNPESRDNSGRTPLSHAAEGGSEEALKLLLEREEVNPESRDNSGRTPFSHAAGSDLECEGALRLLYELEEVDPESRDNSGRTPLSHAAEGGSEEVLKLLFEREQVNPESRDNSGRTPLSHMASAIHAEGAVKLLLERREVNPESRDNSGRTPLAWAAVYGQEKMAKLLLEREEVNPESRDNSGRTPLSHAAGGYWREGVVKLLLEREEVNPESQDNFGRTPISYAANSGGEGIAKLLLQREEVNPESRADSGRTPLSHAARASRDERVVRLLLGRREVNPESRDNSGRTPLAWAALYGQQKVAKLLLEREEVNPESQDNYGRTPLSWALLLLVPEEAAIYQRK